MLNIEDILTSTEVKDHAKARHNPGAGVGYRLLAFQPLLSQKLYKKYGRLFES